MQAIELESERAVVDAIVYALPDIVRGITATRARLSPGLRTPQLRALLRIARDEGLTMGTLARTIGVSYAAATQVVDQLVEMGLVTRERPADDRRVVRLRLTEHAHAELDVVLARRAAQVREVCAHLAPDEARAFAKGLELLGTILMRDAASATGEVAA
jgi:DNA-binding MarR family transcriptional regulator